MNDFPLNISSQVPVVNPVCHLEETEQSSSVQKMPSPEIQSKIQSINSSISKSVFPSFKDFPLKSSFNINKFIKRGNYEMHLDELTGNSELSDQLNYYFDNSKYQGKYYIVDYKSLIEIFAVEKGYLKQKICEVINRKLVETRAELNSYILNTDESKIESAVKSLL